MRRAAMLAASLVAAGASILIGTPAFAEQVTGGCATGLGNNNLKFTGTANYTTIGAQQHWQSAGFKFTGTPPTGSNHVRIYLRTGDITHWSHTSVANNTDLQYCVPVDKTIPANDRNRVRFHANFDIPFLPDPSCLAYAS